MTYLSAKFANSDNTAAEVLTDDRGFILRSIEHDDWPDVLALNPAAYVPPAPIPDWDTFRRSLMISTAWTVAIAPANETRWQLAAIGTATKGDVDPQVVAQLWNALDLSGLQSSHITQLRGAVTSNHIPLVVADNGTIAPT